MQSKRAPLTLLSLLTLVLALGASAGCTPRRAPALGQCVYNSDCADNLDCVLGVCRPQCQSDRDCPTGQRCATEFNVEPMIVGTNVPACVPDDEHFCLYDSECEALGNGLHRCLPDRVCGFECLDDFDCRLADRRQVCDMTQGAQQGTHVCVECNARLPDCSRFGASSRCDLATERCVGSATPADGGNADAATDQGPAG